MPMKSARGVSAKLKGLHKVRSKGRIYFYCWRGGPRLSGNPEVDEQAAAEFFTIRDRLRKEPVGSTFAALISRFRNSREHQSRAVRWRNECHKIHDQLIDEFGPDDISIFEDKRTRSDIKALRDKLSDTPRQADKIIAELRAVLSWAEDSGEIGPHVARRIKKLSKSDRSEIIWSNSEIDAVCTHLTTAAKAIVLLAAQTGLDLTDICTLPKSAVGAHDIQTRRAKTGQNVMIPILPATRAILNGLPSTETTTLLANSRGAPWTADGFQTVFQRAKKKAEIEGKRFKDLRGTACTNFLIAGLSYREAGEVMGWSEKTVERIARRYVHRDKVASATVARVVQNMERTKTVKPV